MSLTLANVQLDVPDDRYDHTVAFWAATLSATPCAVDRTYTHLVEPAATVGIHLQRLPTGHDPAVHLDLAAGGPDDAAVEVARLRELGASEAGAWETVTVLRDPAGLAFCICAGEPTDALGPRDEGRAFLDAVVLDVPAHVQAATATFWAEALRVAPFAPTPNDPDGVYRWSDELRTASGEVLDLGVQRRGDDGAARVHLDVISDDVAGEVARLTGLGARVVDELPRWTVLADPVGTLLCVVDASGPPATVTSPG